MSQELYPTTTIESVEFTGAGAMKANYKGEIKFEVENLPRVLVALQETHATKGKLVFVSEQAQIPAGESAGTGGADTWADTSLQADEEREVEYERLCIGGECPHFCVPKEGDLANQFVCYLDPDALMVVVHGETRCPLYEVGAEEAEAQEEAAVSEDPAGPEDEAAAARGGGVVLALYPGDEDPHVTQVGPETMYGELVFDYFTAARIDSDDPSGFVVWGEEDESDRTLEEVIDPDDYGKRLIVAAKGQAA